MRALHVVIALGLASLASAAVAAEYPSKPIRMIVQFPAGGPTDTAARTVGQALSKALGQAVIIENKPGADGAIAAQAVTAAPADGYTLFFASSSMLALPHVVRPAPFDTLADFAPVSMVGQLVFCMYVAPSLPAQSMQDFVAYARANPGKLNYASNNWAEHLAASQFMKAAGVDMVRVPYKGAAQSMPDLIANRVQVNFGPLAGGLPYAKEGRLRILATMLPQRTALAPEVPTMAEAGIAEISVETYQMILAPANTPREIVARLSREVNQLLQDPEVRAQLERHALLVEGSTPQALAATLRQSDRTWAQFARENNIAER